MYYGYCTVMDIDPLWFLSSDKEKKKKDMTTMSSNPPAKDTSQGAAGKTCQFEGEDLYFKKKIYKWSDGTRIKENPLNLPCGECNQYLFKDKEGCVPYTFEPLENVQEDKSRSFCNIDGPNNTNCIPRTGICTIDAKAPKQICPF